MRTNKMKQRKRPAGRTTIKKHNKITRPLRQGVGAVSTASGMSVSRRRRARNQRAHSARCLNANYPQHLALPRAIGPYTVTRSTCIVAAPAKVFVFGTFEQSYPDAIDTNTDGTRWTNLCCIASGNSSSSISTLNNAVFSSMPGINSTVLGHAVSLVPSAMTVQCMNPEALQTTHGIVYAGGMSMVPKLLGDSRTWESMAQQFIAFQRPRLCAAAKLALTGVEHSLIPMNMNVLSEFTDLATVIGAPSVGTWDYNGTNSRPVELAGFAPLIVYNPDEIDLQFLVTVEYRMRFDLSHPAASTHQFHDPAPMSAWHSAIKGMTELGHGVRDIAQVVADAGTAARSAVALLP